MGKSSLEEDTSLRRLKSRPGLRSMVEIRQGGVVAAKRGEPNEDLVEATPNFLRVGKMLGRSLGLQDLKEVRVIGDERSVTFIESDDRRVGAIYLDDPAQSIKAEHGT
ncbi:MAG: hypothetical protein AAFX93_03210 [Verrucomicrobiota bacterium]